MPGPIHDFFEADHRRLDALLERAVAGTDGIDEAAYARFRKGLLRHLAMEEKLLLPAVRRARGGRLTDDERRLRVDHGALGSLLVPSPTRALVAELRSILEPHDRLEEGPDGLYAAGERLPPEEIRGLLDRAHAYPEVKASRYYDGPKACRTAEEALRRSEQSHRMGHEND